MTSVGYICPECGAGELRLVARLEIGGDSRSDEITVQVAECGSCGVRAAAVQELISCEGCCQTSHAKLSS